MNLLIKRRYFTSQALLLTHRYLHSVLRIAKDDFQVLIVCRNLIFMLVISVETDVQDFSVIVRRHLNLEVQHAGLVFLIIPLSKVDVSYQMLWLVLCGFN